MSRYTPITSFDSAQFPLVPDIQGVRSYANVSNLLQWIDETGGITEYPVVVNTSLFLIMREVLKIRVHDEVKMYIIYDSGYYVFGIAWGDTEVCDLWYYTAKTLPPMFMRLAV